jgi:hypothetical protein
MQAIATVEHPEAVVVSVQVSMSIAEWEYLLDVIRKSESQYYAPLNGLLATVRRAIERLKQRVIEETTATS